ncbi:hypothetical protein LOK49_LG07G01062 [Camellia lanceoleosa]|uniref:Uncharacterized protein n=1 Tax=Camellia lanceoleosa TaxID=1840588 RepID=A0ACC0GXQ4_9ERIC|nr:hypothetical protein LOK49_LG07G01062 [Camellia lanceoleosa]
MTHARHCDITEPVATAGSTDPGVATDSAKADPPRHASPLRKDMLSASGKGCGRGGQPVPANEVVLESTVSQLTKKDHVREGIVTPMEFAPSQRLIPLAQSPVGLGLGPQYFVTEPVDHDLLIKASYSNENRVGPFNEIGIEEISPNSSPTQGSLAGQAIDKCMASFFKELSIKRKALEDLANLPQSKRSSVSSAGVTLSSLVQPPVLNRRLVRNVSRKRSSKHNQSHTSLPQDLTVEDDGTLVQAIANKHDRVDYVCKMIWLAWHIWKNRNNYVFNHLPIDPVATIFAAEKSFCESASHPTQSPLSSSLFSPAQDAPRTWSPPLPGRFKANCDVAIKPGSSSAYMAVLIQDSEGYLMDGVVRIEEVGSVMQGEASAIRWACLVIRDLNLSQVEIVSDNKEVIRLCVSEDAPPWNCAPIIEDIRSLANLCNLSFLWTPRMANEAAHWTARAFLKGVLPSNWVRHHTEGLCKALALS